MGGRRRSSADREVDDGSQQLDDEFFISKKAQSLQDLTYSGHENDNKLDDVTEMHMDHGNVRSSKPSDTSEGRTVFIRNISFDVDEARLSQFFSEFGKLAFLRIVKDKQTQHSRGTAFAKYESREDAEKVILQSSNPDNAHRFIFAGRKLILSLAVSREEVLKLQKSRSNGGFSNNFTNTGRNLHLARVGLIRAGTQAAEGLTSKEMAMRESVARTKLVKLRDPSIFISPLRLCVRNIPLSVDNHRLRQACQKVAGPRARITECRVMRDVKSGAQNPKSLGYAFVAFEEHNDALKTLQVLNNNSKILGGTRKPIVEFSLENSKALEKKRRRAEKSQMMRESKSEGVGSHTLNRLSCSQKAMRGRLPKKKVKGNEKGQKRIMPKKIGPKIRHKQAIKKNKKRQ